MTLVPKTQRPRGVLLASDDTTVQLHRYEPPVELLPFVEHFWSVAWDRRGRAPIVRETLPHPSVHWVVEGGASVIHGVERGRFVRTLRGTGRVVSVKFRPGGFAAFVSVPMHTLTDKGLPATQLLGSAVRGVAKRLREAPVDEAAQRLCDVVMGLDRTPDSQAELAGKIVATIERERDITAVAQVCERFAISTLALQRLFRVKIGVTPKWIIQRYRLHEALERIHADHAAGYATPWAALAVALGFTDQAHFARTFKALIGVTPGEYARRHAVGTELRR